METITIGFSKSRHKFPLYGWAIMLFEGTKFSHVYVKWYSDSLDRDIIYQASGKIVNFVSPTIFNAHNRMVEEFNFSVSSDIKKKVMQFAVDNSGVPYGIKAAIGMGWVRLCRLFGKIVKNPLRDGKATYVCSELVAAIIEECLDKDIPEDLDNVGPRYIYDYLKRTSEDAK